VVHGFVAVRARIGVMIIVAVRVVVVVGVFAVVPVMVVVPVMFAATVFMIVGVSRPAFPLHLELGGAHARARDALRPDCLGGDRQAPERPTHLGQRYPGVDQRAQDHVAGGTREAVEVKELHNLSILSQPKFGPAFHAPRFGQ
jgi:hypothetical protein